jgi:hypothetical protein
VSRQRRGVGSGIGSGVVGVVSIVVWRRQWWALSAIDRSRNATQRSLTGLDEGVNRAGLSAVGVGRSLVSAVDRLIVFDVIGVIEFQ